MPSKTEEYLALAQRTANGLTRYWESWTDYLTTASRLYKYPFADQLMIYAQRPDATACAEFDIWRNRMNRYVRRGSKGIALLDESSGFPRLHYVFDVSDTGVRRNSRDPEVWQLGPDLVQPVSEMLAATYGISGERVSQQLADVAGKLVADYWDNNSGDILAIVDGSLLMDYDEAGVEMQFKSAAAISVTYTLLERCGYEPTGWFDKDDFQAIYNFSTPDSVYALGAAVSDMSREVLRNIERTVKTTIRRRNIERSQYEYEQQERDLLDRRRLPTPEPDPEPAPEAAGQVRQAAPDVPDEPSPGAVPHDADEREPVPAPDGGGADGREPDAADHGAASETEPGPGQGEPADGVGAAHEQPESASRGTGADGADLQLSFFDAHIPTEAEQIGKIDQAESEKSPSAFVLSQAEIENELRKHGSGFQDGKQRIIELYQTQPDRKLRAKALAKEYGIGGHSQDFLDGSSGFVNHDGKGLEFDHYPDHQKVTLSWTQVEKYIDLMIQSDRYLTDKEKEHRAAVQEAERQLPMLDGDAAAEYNALKEQYPNTLIGFELGGYFLFYDKDAITVKEVFRSNLLSQENALGKVKVTGFLRREWVAKSQKLWAEGNSIYLAGQGGDGTHHQTKYLREEDYLPIGIIIKLDGRDFRVDHVNFMFKSVSLQDMDLTNSGQPIFRVERLPNIRELYEQQQDEIIDVSPEKAVDYKVGDEVVVDLPTRTIEGKIGYVGETDVRIDTSAHGQSWDNEVLNKQQFEDGLRRDEPTPDEELDKLPISVEVNGEWQTFPDAAAADEALNAEPMPEAAGNFHITDDNLGVGGPKQKFARNIEAIQTLRTLEQEHRGATAEEQQVLSQYVGWGGLADAFDPGKDSWAKEYAELKGLLSEDEYAAARSSTLNAHYTSPTVIRGIYDAVERMGFRSGNILEPSMGVGNFFGMLPDSMADSRLYGVELDSITGRIAKKLYPQADITVAGFETTDRRDFYDLAVGNVPFGQYKVNDKAYNKLGFSMRYLRISGVLQRKGRGLIISPARHVLAEALAKSTANDKPLIEEYRILCNGAPLPTDNEDVAKSVLNDLMRQMKERRIAFDISDLPLDTPTEINIARRRLESVIAQTDEIQYAQAQCNQWKEISDYMTLLIKGGGKTVYDEDNAIEVPKDETPAYLEWTLWRASLAIDHLVNMPYEVRGFKLDSDFMPVSAAGGGKGDLYCEFEDFTILTEVTMSTSSRQEAMEGEPVRRHVSDAVLKYDKPVYGMFIAVRIDTNTAETFRHGIWYAKDDVKQRLDIVPLTLAQFQKYFVAMFEADKATPQTLCDLLLECESQRDVLEAPSWKKYIDHTVSEKSKGIKTAV